MRVSERTKEIIINCLGCDCCCCLLASSPPPIYEHPGATALQRSTFKYNNKKRKKESIARTFATAAAVAQ